MTTQQELTREDLMRVIQRDRWVKEVLGSRIAALVTENAELMAVLQELQSQPEPATPTVASDGDERASEAPTAAAAASPAP